MTRWSLFLQTPSSSYTTSWDSTAQTAGGTPSTSTVVLIVLAVWLATAIAVAASGVIEDPPRPLLPLVIWIPVLVFLVVLGMSRGFRAWTLGLHLRWLILYHVVRAGVGAGFLLMSGGDLPTEWAVPAGIGDIVVGATAVLVALYASTRTALRRRVVFGWNLLGLIDMVMVFVTAQRLILFGDNPDALVELTRFPLLVVPLFVVSMVFITHFAIFAQLWHTRGRV